MRRRPRGVYISDEVYERARVLADYLGLSVSSLVEMLLEEAVDMAEVLAKQRRPTRGSVLAKILAASRAKIAQLLS